MKKLPILIAVLGWTAGHSLQARPSYVPGLGATCFSGGCHTSPGTGSVTFLKINGSAASAPFGVTLTPGSSFTVEYRVMGLANGGSFAGGFLQPSNGTSLWSASTGPTWTDNSKTGATPWASGGSQMFRTGFAGDGYTFDAGGASDLNGLARNEVFSATLGLSGAFPPGTFSLSLGGAGNMDGGFQRHVISSMNVYVVNFTPTVTPTITLTPTISETPSITETPNLSNTATFTPTISPTFSASPTATVSDTSTPVPGFPGFKYTQFWPNPSAGTVWLCLETYSASDNIELRLYSAAFSRSVTLDLGSYNGGRGSLVLKLPPGMANGAYYGQVISQRQGKVAKSAVMPLVLLR